VSTIAKPEEILSYWLGAVEEDPSWLPERLDFWFNASPEQDREIRERFGATWEAAAGDRLLTWLHRPRSALAVVIVLDQFSRNIHRGTARAFSQDAKAVAISRAGVHEGWHTQLTLPGRYFLYMPFMHAENDESQRLAIRHFQQLVAESPPAYKETMENAVQYAEHHKAIINRFGRFPHRNRVLGRTSTPEEESYLAETKQTFRQ